MSTWRLALLGGLVYALPYAVWLLSGLEAGPASPDLRAAHAALLWAQALALGILLPTLLGDDLARTAAALLVQVAVPWPLLVLVAMTGSLPASDIARAQGAMATLATGMAVLVHLGARAPRRWQPALRAAPQALVLLGLAHWTGLSALGGLA